MHAAGDDSANNKPCQPRLPCARCELAARTPYVPCNSLIETGRPSARRRLLTSVAQSMASIQESGVRLQRCTPPTLCATLVQLSEMNYRLSTSRSARSRSRTLLSIDKNYARRVDTLYRKAFEAPGAIADEATRSRCRLAVMQELDGVCTVFLTHNDSSWPPTRDQLKVVVNETR